MAMLRGLLVLMAIASSEIAFPIEDDSSIMMLQVRAKRVDNQTNQSYHPDSQTNQSYHPEKMEKHYHHHHHHHHHGSGLHYPTKPCLPPICKHQDTKGRCKSAGCNWHEFSSSSSYDGSCSGYAYHFDDPDATSHSCYSFFDKYKCLATNGCRWETNSWSSNGICDFVLHGVPCTMPPKSSTETCQGLPGLWKPNGDVETQMQKTQKKRSLMMKQGK
ncbi:hypothetical protein AK812_SmicGene9376 [Symbiodinium microadriaticum]|uniref:Uncharacterized protein n=1 Tax=Symbiodinium microadriaticum TaxID=2951 RepID=A0A1Q9EII9_SYMMI|nr:hypothetical protein AK812_SmicGene9376 [Symbiodinium microadriaticum]